MCGKVAHFTHTNQEFNLSLPTQAEVVIIGGGIAGCSTAYHLAKMGKTDVLLLEQGKLTSGTTWHAAGLIGAMRPNRNMTVMSKYGIELYASLEAETGLATGWKQCGSVNVASTPERMRTWRPSIRLSRTVRPENNAMFWNVRATPSSAIW